MLFNAHPVFLCVVQVHVPCILKSLSLFLSLMIVHVVMTHVSACENSFYYAVYQCLLFRSVSTPGNGSAVLLAEPAHITYGLHDYHMWKELPPQEVNRVTDWPYRSY